MTGAHDTLRPVWAALDRRLDPRSPALLAVGFSGGSDSLALLRLSLCWAAARRRRVVALTVDHQLQSESGAWTQAAAEAARRLGAEWRVLAWTGPKPCTGLPKAARTARHALLAEAARAAGAAVLLLGHTADDAAESELIRAETPAHGYLREWTPSPVWPQGRHVFLFRPLLGVRREALRRWLKAEGLAWLDDPANADPRFARSRARATLTIRADQIDAGSPPLRSGGGGPREAWWRGLHGPDVCARTAPLTTLRAVPSPRFTGEERRDFAGYLSLDRRYILAEASPADLLAKALLCVGGGARPPGGAAVQRLVERLGSAGAFPATLAGARLSVRNDELLLVRETGRTSPAPLPAPPDQTVVFDGRFELTAAEPGWRFARLAGYAMSLPKAERAALHVIPAEARPTLPVLLDVHGTPRLPAPFGAGPATARSLVLQRWEAALGLIRDERTLRSRVEARAHGGGGPLILS